MKEIRITFEDINQRIDVYLSDKIGLSRSLIQKLIIQGHIRVNQKLTKSGYRIRNHDLISYSIPDPVEFNLEAVDLNLEVLFEDESLIVVNKPSGIVTHPSHGHWERSIVHGILSITSDLSGIGGVKRPGIVHRLDKDTSGCLLIAKNDSMHLLLTDLFKNRKIHKKYLAITQHYSKVKDGWINEPIKRGTVQRKKMFIDSHGKDALTHYRMLMTNKQHSLFMLSPKTGRTHQIRVHLSFLGCPILGDSLYGSKTDGNHSRVMLHAYSIGFWNPIIKKYLKISAPLPIDMKEIIDKLET